MPLPSEILISVAGVDITQHVQPAETRFNQLINAQPGDFTIVVRDKEQALEFTVGAEVQVLLDGAELYGGYVTSVVRKFAFPVVDTATRAAGDVRERQWVLRGVDFNILFDKRVLRNPTDYYHQLPNFGRATYDGTLIREALTDQKYFDVDDAEFDTTTEVDNVARPFDPENESISGDGAWIQQGSTMRQFFEDLVQFSGAVYYIAPDKRFHHKALEDVVAEWGFSDVPDGTTRIGFRDLDATEEGGPSTMVNDALIWGGSEWSGSGQTVFARETDTDSVDDFNRWQVGEVHIGETGYKLQSGVNARANVIVNGAPGAVGGDPNRGLRFPQWNVTLTWFAHQVPSSDHLVPGDIVNIDLHVFGDLELFLPLRSLELTFPAQPSEGNTPETPLTFAQFTGVFSLQLSDPYTLWRFLLQQRNRMDRPQAFAVAEEGEPSSFGARISAEPTPTPDGSEVFFYLEDGDRGYIAGTTEVYLNGLRQRRGIDYTETFPNDGEIEFAVAPETGDELWLVCRITGA